MPTVIRKIFTEETEDELLKMTKDEVTLDLSDKEQRFCECFVRNMNIKMAAIKAGYSKTSAHIVGWKVRQKPDVNRYIAWLKIRVCKSACVEAMDVIDRYVRIAFADITDFVEIKNGRVKIVNGDEIDGQLIKSVKQGKDGVSVELLDPLAALDKLERYMDIMPKDWKEKIEERKLEIMEKKLQIDMFNAGMLGEGEDEDDGFLAALTETAKEVWDDEDSKQS